MTSWITPTKPVSPTPSQLRQVLAYDPLTGTLIWRERGVEWFSDGVVSAEIAARTWNGRCAGKTAFRTNGGSGYQYGPVLGTRHCAHRVAWAIHYGEWPGGQIDHINGDPGDNRIANLRDVRAVENRRNQKLSCRNKSGVSGVRWDASSRLWAVTIGGNKPRPYIGSFKNFDDAVAARRKAEARLGYHPNHGRTE